MFRIPNPKLLKVAIDGNSRFAIQKAIIRLGCHLELTGANIGGKELAVARNQLRSHHLFNFHGVSSIAIAAPPKSLLPKPKLVRDSE